MTTPDSSAGAIIVPRPQKAKGGVRQLPARARLLILSIGVSGGACLALRVPEIARWSGADAWTFVALAAAIAIVELFPLPLRHRTEILFLSLSDALWTMGLLVLLSGPAGGAGGGILVAAVGAGTLVGQALRRRAPVKIAFNIGQYILAVTLAEFIFRALHPLTPSDPVAWLEAALAMGACFCVNACATALVISWVEEESLTSVLLPPLGTNVMHWVGNLSLGVLIAVTWTEVPAAIPLMLIPLAVSYSAYRAWLLGMKERDVMRTLYEAGRSLLGPLDGDGFDQFLALVRTLLSADAAELVMIDGDRVVIRSESETLVLTATSEDGQARSVQAYVRVRDGLAPQVAVIGGPEDPGGLLAVYRAEPLSASEQSLLEALAPQVKARLVNHQLFREIEEQRAQLADIIAHTTDGIFTMSAAGSILSWNPAMTRITGLEDAEAIGRRWADVIAPGTSSSSPIGGSNGSRDILLDRGDGSEHWIRTARSPIRDREGTLTGEVVVTRDVTAELETERLKADFLATVSHELRTPLTPLKGLIATLLAGLGEDSPEARREYYQIMERHAGRLERLIVDLLQVSTIDAGGLSVEFRPVDLRALVAEHVEEVRREHPNRQVAFEAPDEFVIAKADPFRVGQVLSNLLSNAVKHSSSDAPIAVTLAEIGHEAVVSVRDGGDGIHPSDHDRVFERFYRAATTRALQTGGAGLGLYIAKRLLEAMGGRIWLDSAPGNGASFSFSLPVPSEREITEVLSLVAD
jgi:PAS domain S-box-containing protein